MKFALSGRRWFVPYPLSWLLFLSCISPECQSSISRHKSKESPTSWSGEGTSWLIGEKTIVCSVLCTVCLERRDYKESMSSFGSCFQSCSSIISPFPMNLPRNLSSSSSFWNAKIPFLSHRKINRVCVDRLLQLQDPFCRTQESLCFWRAQIKP